MTINTEKIRWLLANARPEIGWPKEAMDALCDITKMCAHYEANARLIAAAPELLKELEKVVRVAEEFQNKPDLLDLAFLATEIRSAISKATGGK